MTTLHLADLGQIRLMEFHLNALSESRTHDAGQ